MAEKYLNEEKYQKSVKTIKSIAAIVLVIGIIIGGSLIGIGASKQIAVNKKYEATTVAPTEDLEAKLNAELEQAEKDLVVEQEKLEARKTELEEKGVEYNAFAGNPNFEDYTDEDYEYKLLVDLLDNKSMNYYRFDEYKDYELTAKYCELKSQIDSIKTDLQPERLKVLQDLEDSDVQHEQTKNKIAKSGELNSSFAFYGIGGFIILISLIAFIYMTVVANGRKIVAFGTQMVMPVAKEGIEDISPSLGVAAKEIAKGVKAGLNDDAADSFVE